jgi:predicted RND superfamily exporter protein
LLASGAGAESRQPIGIVIVFGVTISAVLTLFVVPALYVLFAKRTHSPQHMSQIIEKLRHGISRENPAQAPVEVRDENT